MLTVAPGTKVFLATGRVDLRRGHDGLCALVRSLLSLDPYSGHLFVFTGRRGDRLKILYWDRGGFVLYYKRLAKGQFRLPRVPEGADRVVLDSTELAMLLGGFELGVARRQPAWEPRARPAVAA
jgi:transposase